MDTKSELKKLKTEVAMLRNELDVEKKLRIGRKEFFREFINDWNEDFLERFYSDEGHKNSMKGYI